MGMNPETNKFEPLAEQLKELVEKKDADCREKFETVLVRPDGTPVPKHWTTFKVGELVVIKGYTFEVAYIGESVILFEPVAPVVIGDDGG